MPAYPWLYDDDLDVSHTEGKIITLRNLGVPYPHDYEFKALADAQEQSKKVAADLAQNGVQNVNPNKEIIALIAYLQRVGTDIKKSEPNTTTASH
jgi:cytochrome c oxidase cbb3-type subunit I/II